MFVCIIMSKTTSEESNSAQENTGPHTQPVCEPNRIDVHQILKDRLEENFGRNQKTPAEFDRICSSRYSRDWRDLGSGLQVFPCSGEPELAKFSIDFRPQPGTEAVEADIKRHLDALRQVIPPGHALGYFTQATSRNGPMGPTVECTVRCIIYKNLS